MNDFGQTTDIKRLTAAAKWREDAVSDGWSIQPTYSGHEPVTSTARLTKDGFTALILTRDHGNKLRYRYEVSIRLWGPDSLCIDPPDTYPGFEVIKSLLKKCGYCSSFVEEVHRVSFAGRCCATCLPAMQKKLERPGWCD